MTARRPAPKPKRARFRQRLGLWALLCALGGAGCSSSTPVQQEPGTQRDAGLTQEATASPPDNDSLAPEPTSPKPQSDADSPEPPREADPLPEQREPRSERSSQEPRPERRPEAQPPERTAPEPPPTCPTPQGALWQRVSQQWTDLTPGKGTHSVTLPACGVLGYRIVGAATAEVEVHLKSVAWPANLRLTVYNARTGYGVAQDKPLAQAQTGSQGWLAQTFKVDHSGEILLVVDGQSHPHPVSFGLDIFCTRNCHLEATRFPIVLMHGFAGTDKYFGLLDYFYQVKPTLTKKGYAAFTPAVQPVASSTQRVFALKKKIDAILKQTGARKLNLIAHSQGGVDGRLLISLHGYGRHVASLTTISTPHRGIPVPNLLIPPSQELGEDNMKKYNQQYPNDKQVQYFSYAGVTCGFLDFACRKKYNNETVDALLLATYNALKALRGPNDGLVPVSSAKWGTFLGEIPADHWDEIGQVADRNNKAFQHTTFYLNEARRLRKRDF